MNNCKCALVATALAISFLVGASSAQDGSSSQGKKSGIQPWAADSVPVRDGEHKFSRKVRNYKQLKRQNIVMQRRDYSCGAAALATVAHYYWGDNVDEEFFLTILDHILTVEEAKERVENGLAMTDLRRAAVEAGYSAVVGKLTFDKLSESKVPLVVGITIDGYDHFVVYRGTDGIYVYLADPIRGNLRVRSQKFIKQWQKNAILAIAKPGAKVKEFSRLSITGDELFLGKINDQVIRTASERPITRPNYRAKAPGAP
jgi:predicted double-glycine peptidase